MNPGQLTEKMLNEPRMNKYSKLLMGSVAGTADNLKVALKWLGERQDYQMMGAKGVKLAYERLRELRLVPSYHDWLKKQQLKQTQSSHGLLREATLNPHTPRHMATYANNLLIQVRAALEFMCNLKSREHSEHIKGRVLVPLTKWNQIMQEKPHSHPFVSDVVAATINERLDKDDLSYQSAGITLLGIKGYEKWLYEVPELTETVERQLVRTAAVFGQWNGWLEEERLIEKKINDKILSEGHFRHFKLLTTFLSGKAQPAVGNQQPAAADPVQNILRRQITMTASMGNTAASSGLHSVKHSPERFGRSHAASARKEESLKRIRLNRGQGKFGHGGARSGKSSFSSQFKAILSGNRSGGAGKLSNVSEMDAEMYESDGDDGIIPASDREESQSPLNRNLSVSVAMGMASNPAVAMVGEGERASSLSFAAKDQNQLLASMNNKINQASQQQIL